MTSAGPLVVVGDAMLDRDVYGTVDRVCPDAPVPVVRVEGEHARSGGAALAAVLAGQRHTGPVVLVTALGADEAGAQLASLLEAAGVTVVDLGAEGPTVEKVRVRAAGQSLLRLDRGDQPSPARPPRSVAPAVEALTAAVAVLVSDYGGGLTAAGPLRRWLADAAARLPTVWDPHPRGAEPVAACRLATPNRAEATHTGALPPWPPEPTHTRALPGVGELVAAATTLVERWQAHGVAITLGADGAVLVDRAGTPRFTPAPVVDGGDPCGAGDCFAAAAAVALAEGALPSEAVDRAVADAAAFVAAGGAGTVRPVPAVPSSTPQCARGVATTVASVRATGGTVVATGGCFDLVHAGHVAMLDDARRLGDWLVVLLNSDDSVRRLKGPGRPLQSQDDRAAVLRSLGSVDDVIVFDEDTPVAALEVLRPDVFVKGGDYTVADLPEAAALRRWGGNAVVVPYLPGRSTTRLVKGASRHDR